MPTHRRAALAGLIALLASGAPDARAENLVCQTIGNKTECRRGDGPLACHGDGNRVQCTGGPQRQDAPAVQDPLGLGDDENEDLGMAPVETPKVRIDGDGVSIDIR